MGGFSFYVALRWPPALIVEWSPDAETDEPEGSSSVSVSDVKIDVEETEGAYANRMGFRPRQR